ncbi:hypothetical protein [Bacillus swezeyi]|uniref:Uncharacterized protein n=1 Tax=Bacillus swezeyi TaxID=1925020 RepID=A0A5M8REE2_9BACI|nr:hypothetical protein [Bacillus swezeyi]KAA6446945.1 hypothetical protein DX927_23120 [Bacillus swezeyi]KAA6471513.1 hypothetical protein DX928_23360 [Bacillus swezeyi]
MNFKLIINSKFNKELPCCKNSCELYDQITGECGIHNKIDTTNPQIYHRCFDKLPYFSYSYEDCSSISEEKFYEQDDINFFEIAGDASSLTYSDYPLKPDFSSNRDDAIWFVASDRSFGCWIINHYKKRLMPVTDGTVVRGWNKNVYQSPYPLHNHDSSKSIASRMAWYVDNEGYGQYVLLLNGKISMISSPRPAHWKK